jgi:hypothetical protein
MKFDDSHNVTSGPKSGDPLLQIPCGLMILETDTATKPASDDVLPLSTIIDTSLATSTIHSNALQKYPRLQALVRQENDYNDNKGKLLYLPSSTLQLRMGSIEATVAAPALQISKDDQSSEWELRLGLDFLRQYQAVVDIQDESLLLRVPSQDGRAAVMVPFLRPRGSLDLGGESEL